MSVTFDNEHQNRLRAAQAISDGRFADAEIAWRTLLERCPRDTDIHVNLGATLRMLGRESEAWHLFQQALAIAPNSVYALTNLAQMCDERGQLPEAIGYYEKALAIAPSPELRLLSATILPAIYQNADDVLAWRQRLTAELDRCHADGICCDLTEHPGTVLFYLAYQGKNDRDLHRSFARLHRTPAVPKPNPLPDRAGRKLRVGFLSRHLREHTIGRLFHGAILRLNTQALEVAVFSLGHFTDSVADTLRRGVSEYVELPFDLRAARQAVLDRRLDILCYCDIGMEPWSAALAHARLAPVQCSTWGHPVTTGIDTVDYFISTEALEVAEADGHYSEVLVRLPRLFCYYERPRLPEPRANRAKFGLPEDMHLYGCLQTIFKFHPDFDALVAAILRRDPRGLLTLVAGSCGAWLDHLQQRFRRTMPDVLDRIRVLPSLPRDEYLQLVAVHDVLLDPPHFGGGNTSYEGFACGVPIVTWPSKLLRGRITAALYSQMGLNDCVVHGAEEYIEMAVRLATDGEYRRHTVARIEQAAPTIFDNDAGVRDLEAFFQQVLK